MMDIAQKCLLSIKELRFETYINIFSYINKIPSFPIKIFLSIKKHEYMLK